MKAKFKEKDGSLGLINGKEYDIEIVMNNDFPLMLGIKDSSFYRCPYASLEKLFENWEFEINKK